jgi:hypothetical protein
MAIKYHIDSVSNVVYVDLAGVIHDPDVLLTLDEALHSPKFHTEMSTLVDFRDLERLDVSRPTLQQAAETVEEHLNGSKHPRKAAFIIPGDRIAGLSRMYWLLRGTSMETVGIFESARVARKWLELPENGSGA